MSFAALWDCVCGKRTAVTVMPRCETMRRFSGLAVLGVCAVLGVFSVAVLADGDETLGPPTTEIFSGTGIISAGTGLLTQPGSITVVVPNTAVVIQVLLYWQGFMGADVPGDDTIEISDGGTPDTVMGTLIGSSVPGMFGRAFRADITALGLVQSGMNTLTVDGLNFDLNMGAGVMVVFDDFTTLSDIQILDGHDWAYINSLGSLMVTEQQTFSITPPSTDQQATLSLFFSSVSGSSSGGGFRPSAIEIIVDGNTETLVNALDSNDGDEWDTLTVQVDIPAGASEVKVQAFSRDDIPLGNLPSSLVWIAAGLASPIELEPSACRVTAGGNKLGFTEPCTLKSNGMPSSDCAVKGPDRWGGQAGAPPRVDGNWTHQHKPSARDMFVFHSNSLFDITCSDPGDFCEPARFAPDRQIDFAGIGRITTKKGDFAGFPDGDLCFAVHLEDLGEPGPGGRKTNVDPSLCTHCPGTTIVNEVDCENCTDYYMIKIYGNAQCMGDPIYVNGPGVPANCGPDDPALGGYFVGFGNVQMHPDNNGPE